MSGDPWVPAKATTKRIDLKQPTNAQSVHRTHYTDSSIHLYVPIRVPSRFPRWPFLTSIFPHITNSFPRTLDNLTPYFTEKTCNHLFTQQTH